MHFEVGQMRRFETIHKVPSHGLKSSIPSTIDLQPYVVASINELQSVCTNIPSMDYTIQWSNMSHDTLAYTYTWYQWDSSVWVSANRFEVHFNPHKQWWNGTCSELPPNHYDLKSAIMHEILHGIGYVSTIDSTKNAWPTNYDRMIKNSAGLTLVTTNGQYTGQFGSPVYIDSIRMYNPSTFNSGSSFSHVHRSSKLMSWYQSGCYRHFDHDTKIILNRLGYGCGASTKIGGGGSGMAIVGVIAGIVVVIGIVVGVLVGSKSGRKKRELEPLLKK